MDEIEREELDPHEEELADLEAVDGVDKKLPKDLIDEDVESLEDLADDEEEDDEPFDDVDAM